MSKLLRENDILNIEKGFKIYAKIPDKFIVSNRRISNEVNEHSFIVGEILSVSSSDKKREKIALINSIENAFKYHGVSITREKIAEFLKSININLNTNEEKLDTSIFIGPYIVKSTELVHGGYDRGSRYPDHLKIIAKKMNNGKVDPNGLEISFYQYIDL